MNSIRIGSGYDVHQLVEHRDLIIGGVKIDHSRGLLGHSDADVLLHAISDALLGSVCLGDIGQHFSPKDSKWKDADSGMILKLVYDMVMAEGFRLVNMDSTVMAEEPRLNPHIQAMRIKIAGILKCDLELISIKATTTESLGFTGRKEGIAAQSVVLVQRVS